jgi:hypothetical protein
MMLLYCQHCTGGIRFIYGFHQGVYSDFGRLTECCNENKIEYDYRKTDSHNIIIDLEHLNYDRK